MGELSTVAARSQFAEVVNRAAYGHERLVLTRRGKQLVAIIPIEDLHLLEVLEDQFDVEEARLALREAAGQTVPWETLKAELEL